MGYEYYGIEISIARPESESPPPADVTPKDGKASYHEIEEYFEKRFHLYNPIAKEICLRVLKYFKYKHGMPFLLEQGDLISKFPLPRWVDEDGNEIWKSRSRIISVPYVPGAWDPEYGIVKFERKYAGNFRRALEKGVKISLFEEILVDAQSAILLKNYRRGILEMAIACETAVYQTFFINSSFSKSTLAYLVIEKNHTMHFRSIIDTIADYTFGSSFKKFSSDDYKNIDYLFRCRNRIVHRGEVKYRDDSAKWIVPDKELLKQWWSSIENLLKWLSTIK